MLPHAIVAIDFGTECKSHLLSYRCYDCIRQQWYPGEFLTSAAVTKVCYTARTNDGASFENTTTIFWRDGPAQKPILPTAVTKKPDAPTTYGWQALDDGELMAYDTTYLAFKLDLLKSKSHIFALGDSSCQFAADLT